MTIAIEQLVSVVYCADEHDYRQKRCGLSLANQLLISLESLRTNWSKLVDVYLFHTAPLTQRLSDQLQALKVKPISVNGPLQSGFPLANKILVGAGYSGSKDILFLDCDTRIYRPPVFDTNREIGVSFDALQAVSYETYRDFFGFLKLPMPSGEVFPDPAFQYYRRGISNQFPQFNSGVYFLKKCQQTPFYVEWQRLFRKAHAHFAGSTWEFYLEQLSFAAAILSLKLDVGLFPPGINFICTPRAPYLKDWPQEDIIIEHYAGDTSQPLVFVSGHIDPVASGLTPMPACL